MGSIQHSPYVRLPTCETGSRETAPSATQSRGCSHSGIAPGLTAGFSLDVGRFRRWRKGRRESRRVWGDVAAGVRVIVSRARFRGPGVGRTVWCSRLVEWPVCARESCTGRRGARARRWRVADRVCWTATAERLERGICHSVPDAALSDRPDADLGSQLPAGHPAPERDGVLVRPAAPVQPVSALARRPAQGTRATAAAEPEDHAVCARAVARQGRVPRRRYRGEETPRRFTLGKQLIEILVVVDQWCTPNPRYFRVRTAASESYTLRHGVGSGVWELTDSEGSRPLFSLGPSEEQTKPRL